MLWAPWWLWLSLRLDAEVMDTTPDDLLSAVAILHAPDLYEAARDGSPTLTLDALHPVYLCVDPGMDPLGIRTDWWFSVGWHLDASAHFGWLRRWWPACWRLAVEIDPEVGRLS